MKASHGIVIVYAGLFMCGVCMCACSVVWRYATGDVNALSGVTCVGCECWWWRAASCVLSCQNMSCWVTALKVVFCSSLTHISSHLSVVNSADSLEIAWRLRTLTSRIKGTENVCQHINNSHRNNKVINLHDNHNDWTNVADIPMWMWCEMSSR